jgi:hypothetical protein
MLHLGVVEKFLTYDLSVTNRIWAGWLGSIFGLRRYLSVEPASQGMC